MKIVAPISRVDEVAALAAAGAREIYCGIVRKILRLLNLMQRTTSAINTVCWWAQVIGLISGHSLSAVEIS